MRLLFSVILVVGFSTYVQADSLRTIHSFKEAAPVLEDINPGDTLVLYDIDQTLLETKNPLSQPNNIFHNPEISSAFKEIENKLGKEVFQLSWHLSVLDPAGDEVVEPGSQQFVQGLIDQGFRSIAITAGTTISSPMTDDPASHRVSVLHELGYDFTGAFPGLARHQFTNLPGFFGGYPEYNEGVLLCNVSYGTPSKGEVLVDFLEYAGYLPKTIVMFDDRPSNVETAQQVIADKYPNIRFVGFEYKAYTLPEPAKISKQDFYANWYKLGEHAQQVLASIGERKKAA